MGISELFTALAVHAKSERTTLYKWAEQRASQEQRRRVSHWLSGHAERSAPLSARGR